jgi:lysophospholipase L1-like esterase
MPQNNQEEHTPADAMRVTIETTDGASRAVFESSQVSHQFFQDFVAFAVRDLPTLPRRDSALALGSSSIRRWETLHGDLAPLDIIHCGFGGSTMADVMDFLDYFVLYQPKIALVYEGDNDIGRGAEPETVLSHMQTFVDAMLAARNDTQIFFVSPKPSILRREMVDTFLRMKAMLAEFVASDPRLNMIDVWTPMCHADGSVREDLFVEDGLHMNAAGYAIWTEAILPLLLAANG